MLETVNHLTKQYGFIGGPKIALQCKLGDRSRKLFTVTLPDFPAPIWLRGGTVDLKVFVQVVANKDYDISDTAQGKELRGRYECLIAAGVQPLIIDCGGANIGLITIWYARQFPEARIIAVEPDPSNLEIASKNLVAYPNVTVVEGGVWDRSSQLSIVNPDAEPWAFQVDEGAGSIPAFTMDQLSEGKPILIAKIDIEGAEKALFRSNIGWMDRTDLIAIELHDWLFPNAGTSEAFMKAIARHSHEMAMRGESLSFLTTGQSPHGLLQPMSVVSNPRSLTCWS